MKTINLFIVSSLISIIVAVPVAQSDVDGSFLSPTLAQSELGDKDVAQPSALDGLPVDPSLDPAETDTSDISETGQSGFLGSSGQSQILQSDTGLLPVPPTGSKLPSTSGRFQSVSSEDGGMGTGSVLAQAGYNPLGSASSGNCIGSDACSGLATTHSFQGITSRYPTACNYHGFDGSTAMIVALPAEFMGPEVYDANPYCNKQITLTYRGRSVNAFVADKCRPGGCRGHNLIVSTSVMRALSPGSRALRGVSWSVDPNVGQRPLQGTVVSSVPRRPNGHGRKIRNGSASRSQRIRLGSDRRPNGSASRSAASQSQQPQNGGGASSPPRHVPTGSGGTSPGNGRTTIWVAPPASKKVSPSGSDSTSPGAGTSSPGSTTPGATTPDSQPFQPDSRIKDSKSSTDAAGSTPPTTPKSPSGSGNTGSGGGTPSSRSKHPTENSASISTLKDLGIPTDLKESPYKPFVVDPDHIRP